jgi:hypothetical protein
MPGRRDAARCRPPGVVGFGRGNDSVVVVLVVEFMEARCLGGDGEVEWIVLETIHQRFDVVSGA